MGRKVPNDRERGEVVIFWIRKEFSRTLAVLVTAVLMVLIAGVCRSFGQVPISVTDSSGSINRTSGSIKRYTPAGIQLKRLDSPVSSTGQA